jgi:uncharacterized protein with NRDE domain
VPEWKDCFCKATARSYRTGDYLDLMDDSVPPEERSGSQPSAAWDWERSLSSMRIMKGEYGTRCSTAIQWSENGKSRFAERTYHRNGEIEGEVNYLFRVDGSRSLIST